MKKLLSLFISAVLTTTTLANLGYTEEQERNSQTIPAFEYNIPDDSNCKVLIFDYPAQTMCVMFLKGKVASELWYNKDGTSISPSFIKEQCFKYDTNWHYMEPIFEGHISIGSDNGFYFASRGVMPQMKISSGFVILSKDWIDYAKSVMFNLKV